MENYGKLFHQRFRFKCQHHAKSDILERHGPFVGIMGSSTGATVAAIVTSLLQKRRSICNFNLTVTMSEYYLGACSRSPLDGVCYLSERVST
ncbi:hypothetical protein N7449_004432 [Penicillium cf. viridicatum]|uniref:Serine hydrolase domain-containing protein n=1 Tax=Penicillium cf. viridicatum TaxID=2972119 RepID=A0A9W9SXY4_9EURO|nr:hypothetical protein N7449_004432 [Penicillium cf. viridicatum]